MRSLAILLACSVLSPLLTGQSQNLVFITNENVGGVSGGGAAGGFGAGTGDTRKVLIFDIDNDGEDDIYFLNHGGASRGLINGGGVFADDSVGNDPVYQATATKAAKGAVPFDLGNDGDLDLYVACGPVGGVQQTNLWLTNRDNALLPDDPTKFIDISDPVFNLPFNFDHSYDAGFMVLNGLGSILVANRRIDGVAGSGQNRIYVNTAGSTFSELPAADGTFNSALPGEVMSSRDLVVADFNGDGLDDVFVCNAGNGPQPNQVFRQTTGPASQLVPDAVAAFSAVPGDSYGATAADLDGDGDLDLCVANRVTFTVGQANALFRNDGANDGANNAMAFSFQGATALTADVETSYDVSFADLDLDGDQDLIVANNQADNSVYMSNVVDDGVGPFDAGAYTKVTTGVLQNPRDRTRSLVVAQLGDYGPATHVNGLEVVFANTIAGGNEFFRGMGQQFADLDLGGGDTGATTGVLAVRLDGDGFFTTSAQAAGGALRVTGGQASSAVRLDMALVASAVPVGAGGTLIASGGTSVVDALDGLGALDLAVPAAQIPAALKGLELFVQAVTDESGSAPGSFDAASNGLSIIVQ